MKKIVQTIIFLLAIVVLAVVIWVRYIPAGKIDFVRNNLDIIKKPLCLDVVWIFDDDMAPRLNRNSFVVLDKCFDPEDLGAYSIIRFKDNKDIHLGVIRNVFESEKVSSYQVSPEATPGVVYDVSYDEVVSLYR